MIPHNMKHAIVDRDMYLQCPNCGEDYLHHAEIEAFERTEDSRVGLHVTVGGDGVSVDSDLRGNPSSRRHGALIGFWCEMCDSEPTMAIIQHKGNTFLGWDRESIAPGADDD